MDDIFLHKQNFKAIDACQDLTRALIYLDDNDYEIVRVEFEQGKLPIVTINSPEQALKGSVNLGQNHQTIDLRFAGKTTCSVVWETKQPRLIN